MRPLSSGEHRVMVDRVGRPLTPGQLAQIVTADTGTPWRPYSHLRLVDRELAEVVSGRNQFLLINEPPRTGKSLLIDVFTCAHFLGVNPDEQILLVTFAHELAIEWGQQVRDVLEEWGWLYGIGVRRDVRARGRFQLAGHKGSMRSIGVGGIATGRGADMLVIDDPHRDQMDADSITSQERVWRSYTGSFRTRLQGRRPRIVVAHARFNPGDLSGRILRSMATPGADQFRHINLPMVSEGPGDPLGRPKGQLLVPQLRSRSEVTALHALDRRYFWAQQQQRPVDVQGDLFPDTAIRFVDELPAKSRAEQPLVWVRQWDMAGSEPEPGKDPDWTCGVLLAYDPDTGLTYIVDVRRIRAAEKDAQAFMKRAVPWDDAVARQRVPIRLEQEPGSSGKNLVSIYRRTVFAGRDFDARTSTGSKVTRARPLSGQWTAGNVAILTRWTEGRDYVTATGLHVREEGMYLPPAWTDWYLAEMNAFPDPAWHDDAVDATAAGYISAVESVRPGGTGLRRLPRPKRGP